MEILLAVLYILFIYVVRYIFVHNNQEPEVNYEYHELRNDLRRQNIKNKKLTLLIRDMHRNMEFDRYKYTMLEEKYEKLKKKKTVQDNTIKPKKRKRKFFSFFRKKKKDNIINGIIDTKKIEADDDCIKCTICFENNIDTLFLPCKHFYICSECSDKINDCSICRVPIDDKIIVFTPFDE